MAEAEAKEAVPVPGAPPEAPRLSKHYTFASVPSLIGPGVTELNTREKQVDERIRTLCLVILASAVLAATAYYLDEILVPFVLALALKYLLTPLIDALSCSCGRLRMPRVLAVLIALLLAGWGLVLVGEIVATSISEFAAHSSSYRERIQQIVESLLRLSLYMERLLGRSSSGASVESRFIEWQEGISNFLKQVSITDLILAALGTVAHAAENLM